MDSEEHQHSSTETEEKAMNSQRARELAENAARIAARIDAAAGGRMVR